MAKEKRSVLPRGFEKPVDETENRREYWCGVTEDCPLKDLYAGGIDFPKYTEKVTGGIGNTIRTRKKGIIHFLSDKQVDRIREMISRKVIRMKLINKEEQGDVYNTNNRAYFRDPADQPAAAFVYMIPKEDSESARANNEDPVTLLDAQIAEDSAGAKPTPREPKAAKKAEPTTPDPDAEWKTKDDGDDDPEWKEPSEPTVYPGETEQPWYGKNDKDLTRGQKGAKTKWLKKAAKKAEKALA